MIRIETIQWKYIVKVLMGPSQTLIVMNAKIITKEVDHSSKFTWHDSYQWFGKRVNVVDKFNRGWAILEQLQTLRNQFVFNLP